MLLLMNEISGQSNLTTQGALLPHMDGSMVFARWR